MTIPCLRARVSPTGSQRIPRCVMCFAIPPVILTCWLSLCRLAAPLVARLWCRFNSSERAVLCCAVLCCAVFCCGVVWCAVLCCAVLCCVLLWCGVVCCGVLWCAVL
jgi:hypothetical protein